jgi:hypothetical protein
MTGSAPDGCHILDWINRLPRVRLVAVSRPAGGFQAALDRARRGRVGGVGDAPRRRRRQGPRPDAVRPQRALFAGGRPAAGPPSDDAALLTCAYLVEGSAQWVMQSLFLSAIADVKERDRKATRGTRQPLPPGGIGGERFLVHRAVFPSDFLADFGFRTLRRVGRVELARLDLGGPQPVAERPRAKLIR